PPRSAATPASIAPGLAWVSVANSKSAVLWMMRSTIASSGGAIRTPRATSSARIIAKDWAAIAAGCNITSSLLLMPPNVQPARRRNQSALYRLLLQVAGHKSQNAGACDMRRTVKLSWTARNLVSPRHHMFLPVMVGLGQRGDHIPDLVFQPKLRPGGQEQHIR